ncbi:MAG: FHA domain-containing protein [Lachnospiraceae bacterium]|nr:FHA domain-containing protein [Lachnospiraceae bacterium]
MEVRYKKDMNHNYLILEYPNDIDYETNMMLKNRINGLLKGKKYKFNGCTELYYDITSKQPLSRIYEKRELSAVDVEGVLISIRNLHGELKRYLLSAEKVIFDPDYCYCNPESCRPEWVFYGKRADGNGLRNLAEFLIDRVNHGDKQAVDMTYRFYKMVKDDVLTIRELEELLEVNSRKENEEVDLKDKRQEDMILDFSNEIMETSHQMHFEDISSAEEGKLAFYGRKIKQKIKELLEEKIKSIRPQQEHNYMRKDNKRNINIKDKSEDARRGKFEEDTYNKEWETFGLEKNEYYTGETVVMGLKNPLDVRRLRSLSKGSKSIISLDKLPCTLGKMEEYADIVLNDPSISRLHVRLFEEDGEIYMQDLNSKNGSYINNLELEANEIVKLKLGDEVIFGNLRYVFE